MAGLLLSTGRVVYRRLVEGHLGGSMLCLVVDDEPYIRLYIGTILRREGFEIVEAESGTAAFEIVETLRGRVDLIVTDIQMPNGDGLSLANTVRSTFPLVPIILVSARTKPDTVFEFVEKPFAASTLAGAIRKFLTRTPTPA